MKATGGLLLILGIIGLLLNLIFWLPASFNLVVAALISVVCFVAVWGGGKLLQAKTEFAQAQVKQYGTAAQPARRIQQSVACPKCGCQIVPGQQFCGGCSSSLVSYCAKCGVAVTAPSRFCGNCGARLG